MKIDPLYSVLILILVAIISAIAVWVIYGVLR